MIRHPPEPPLFPSTPLFRSRRGLLLALAEHDVDAVPARLQTAASSPDDVLDTLVAVLADTASQIDSPARFAHHLDRKSTRLNSSRQYLVCRLLLEKKKIQTR